MVIRLYFHLFWKHGDKILGLNQYKSGFEVNKSILANSCQNNHLSEERKLIIFTNPSARAGYDTRSIFKRSLKVWNQSFPSPRLVAEEPSLPYYLPIAGGIIIGFIPFPRVLVLCEMPSVSSRIWTRVLVSISYDDNNYTTGISERKLIDRKV